MLKIKHSSFSSSFRSPEARSFIILFSHCLLEIVSSVSRCTGDISPMGDCLTSELPPSPISSTSVGAVSFSWWPESGLNSWASPGGRDSFIKGSSYGEGPWKGDLDFWEPSSGRSLTWVGFIVADHKMEPWLNFGSLEVGPLVSKGESIFPIFNFLWWATLYHFGSLL